jgi:hypothetical protein
MAQITRVNTVLCLLTKAVFLGTQHSLKMMSRVRRNDKVLIALLNLYVLIKIRVVTFDTNRYVADSTQTINRCFRPEASHATRIVKSAVLTIGIVDRLVEKIMLSIGLRLSVHFCVQCT